MDVNAQSTNHWFLFDGSEVSGPFAINELNSTKQKSSKTDLDRLMVSKPGLSQWVPLSALETIFNQAAGDENEIPNQKLALNSVLEASLQTLNDLALNKFKAETTQTFATPQPSVPAPTQTTSQVNIEKPARIDQHLVQIDALPERLNYLSQRGRLRLGDQRSSIWSGFIMTLLTLGFYIPAWLKISSRELKWHLNNDLQTTTTPNLFMRLLPLLNIFAFRSVAETVKFAEARSGYNKTNTTLAGVLAIIPPFAIFYLQKNLNFYWHQKAIETKPQDFV